METIQMSLEQLYRFHLPHSQLTVTLTKMLMVSATIKMTVLVN